MTLGLDPRGCFAKVPRQNSAGVRALFLGLFCLFDELADLSEGLVAQVMLDLAGVLRGHFGRDPQQREQPGETFVTVVDPAGNGHAAFIERDQSFGIHGDIAVFPQLLHGDADAGLGVSQLVDDVNGPHLPPPLLQNQDGLQIVLCGLVDYHGAQPFSLENKSLAGKREPPIGRDLFRAGKVMRIVEKRETCFNMSLFFGGDKRDRTADLLTASQALSRTIGYAPPDGL